MKINVNDISLNYTEVGKQKYHSLIFIHGFPFSNEMWKPQLNALPDSVHAIAYDIRGHGKSDLGDGQYTIDLFVDDLFALLDRLAINHPILCGLSMGGYISLRAFERNPDKFAGLILCDTKSEPDTNEDKIKRTSSIKTLKSSGVSVFTENFVKAIFWTKTFETDPETIDFINEIIRANPTLGICGTLLALAARTDTTRSLSSIHVPTCIIAGEYDLLTPPSVAQELHKAIAGSELHILPNAGHMSNLENTKDFNETLVAFLRKHW